MSAFGKKIAEIRTSNSKTLGFVASALGLRISYLSDIEHGRKKPFPPEILKLFCELFDCDERELQRLAARERDSVEIPLQQSRPLHGELAYVLARSMGGLEDADVEEMLDFLRTRHNKSSGKEKK